MKRLLITAVVASCLLVPFAANAKGFHIPWCGIYMTHYFGIFKRSLWAAANWRFEGFKSDGPCVGCVVVWPHHVGVIAGGPNEKGKWLVHSGNDGNAVRTRYRSLHGVIAFRRISNHSNLEVQQQAATGRHEHLVAHAVRGRRIAARLRKTRTAAVAAPKFGSGPPPIAAPAHLTNEVVGQHRQPVVQGPGVLFAINTMYKYAVHKITAQKPLRPFRSHVHSPRLTSRPSSTDVDKSRIGGV